MSKKRLYDILGVSPEASEQEIRRAYRELARKHHPDRNPGNKQAEERFKQASYASEILLNKKKRGLYDEFGEIGLREGFDPDAYRAFAERQGQRGAGTGGFGGLEDLFDQARRRGGGAGTAGSVEDLFSAEVLEGLFGRRGRRGRKTATPDLVSDLTVDLMEAARGAERELTLSGPGGQRSLKVRIPAGVREGGQIRLRGQGDGGGDVVLRIHVKEHPELRAEGDDLLFELPISVGEAFRGAQIEVPTPDGSVKLRIPKGVRGGSRLRLKGKGIRRGEKTGDLLVQLHIVLPSAEAASGLIDQLEKLYDTPVRGPKPD